MIGGQYTSGGEVHTDTGIATLDVSQNPLDMCSLRAQQHFLHIVGRLAW